MCDAYLYEQSHKTSSNKIKIGNQIFVYIFRVSFYLFLVKYPMPMKFTINNTS